MAKTAKPKPRKNDAEYCRLKGWVPGTILTLELDDVPGKWFKERIRITAVGEASILIRYLFESGNETPEHHWCRRLLNRTVLSCELPAKGGQP